MSRDIGQYKVGEQIGKGSFGRVYKGIDKLTNQQVALKFIDKKNKKPRELLNLRSENELLKKINHQNVICLKDVIQTSKEIIIVTDYAGKDLSGVIEEIRAKKERFSLHQVKDYSKQILDAMVYLSQNKIVHRDLKPQNILINSNHIKLCDFGFAKKLSASTSFLLSMKGTPLYLAPQIVRQTKYTEKVDVWSFGCIIYQLYTGRTPYYANTFQKLAPLILYQQVHYPKDMPSQLKQLITAMLQKNPAVRPNWKQLKNNPFFKVVDPLQQKLFKNNMKQVISVQMNSVNQGSQNYKQQKQKQEMLESKVIQKLDNQNDFQKYLNEFKQIQAKMKENTINLSELKTDIIFFHKIKEIFLFRSQDNPLVTNEIIDIIFNILNTLIKNKKANNQNAPKNEEQDITKNQALIIGILCFAKNQNNFQMLQKQLRMICLLVKGNFNGVQINPQIDEQISDFITQILQKKDLPFQCLRNGLMIIGTLANQAMFTINNSYGYFERIAEDKLLSKVALLYKKDEKRSVVLQCLKQFIHPIRQLDKNVTTNCLLYAKILGILKSLKQQIAQSLLKTDFFSQISPLDVYDSQKNNSIIDYCQILLQCLQNSDKTRQEYLKYNYWNDFLSDRKINSFIFAFNSIFIQKNNINTISNQKIQDYTNQSQKNKLINVFIIEMGYYNIKKKANSSKKNVANYLVFILEKIEQFLFLENIIKQKSSKEVYGVFPLIQKVFDEPLVEIFGQIVQNIRQYPEKQEIVKLCQRIFQKVCDLKNSFRPSIPSLYVLMKIFTQSQIAKQLRYQKHIKNFFFECMGEMLKKQQTQHLDIYFEQAQQPAFIAKYIHTANHLIDIEQSLKKESQTSISDSNILSLAQLILTSSFYRLMFIRSLTENQFYQHIRYCEKIITKTKIKDKQFTNFLGVVALPIIKDFIHTKNQSLLIEMFLFISQIARQSNDYNEKILETRIITKIKEWLTQNTYSQYLKEKVLYMIGNLAKNSQYFFEQFTSYSVLQSVANCLFNNSKHPKILKNAIYSVGNISYYNQKFHNQIKPMVPIFLATFDSEDVHLKNNLISTVSNLMRHSSVYLSELIKTGMIENILKIAVLSTQKDIQSFSLSLSVIKKVIQYQQFFDTFGYKDLKLIYQKKDLVGGDKHQAIKKIREALNKY